MEEKKHSSIKGFIVAIICLAVIIALNHRLRKSSLYEDRPLFQESVKDKNNSRQSINSDTIVLKMKFDHIFH